MDEEVEPVIEDPRSDLAAYRPPLGLWGALVYQARRQRQLTQTELARQAGMQQQTVSKIEAGELCPHDSAKLRLSEALDLNTADLFPWPPQGRPKRSHAGKR